MKITGLIALLAGFLALTITMGCDMEYLEKMVNEIYVDEEVSTGNTQATPTAPSTPSDGTPGTDTDDDSTDTNQGSGSGQNPGGTTSPTPPNQGETTDPNTPNPDGGTPNTPTPDETPTGPDQDGGSTGTNPDGGTANPDQGGGGSGSTSGDSTGTTTGGSSTGTNQGGGSTSNPGTPAGPTITWGSSTPDDPFTNASGSVENVSTPEEFLVAIQKTNVSIINLIKDITTPRPLGGRDDILIIGNTGRSLTINGNGKTLTVNYAGIVLGGNLKLSNITLSLTNFVRNAIIANGYNLTLENVTNATSTQNRSIHLFCGGITNYTGSNVVSLPASGTHGQIIVKGEKNNQLGHIYAGSFDDAPNEEQSRDNEWQYKSTITWTVEAKGFIGGVYGHGARESRGAGTSTGGNELYPDPNKYRCSGTVQINISNSAKPDRNVLNLQQITIDGATGSGTNALVCYTGSSGNRFSVLLKNIEGLKLEPGTAGKAVLAPVDGSTLQGTHLAIPTNTEFYFTNLDASGSFNLSSMEGGGALVLGIYQNMEITGQITRTTKVAFGGIQNGSNSFSRPIVPSAYIIAPNSLPDSFVLLPPSVDSSMKLVRDEFGYWRTFTTP